MKFANVAGIRFGRLTAKVPIRNPNGRYSWRCDCGCGDTVVVRVADLLSKHTRSCGCLKRQIARKRMLRHGHTANSVVSSEYRTWCAMKYRCENPNDKRYAHYGGRGIKVCKRWQSFRMFFRDMGNRPTGATLERKNNNGNYTPSNCVWASLLKQANNRQNNRHITYQGETLTVAQWAKKLKVKYSTLYMRLYRGKPAI